MHHHMGEVEAPLVGDGADTRNVQQIGSRTDLQSIIHDIDEPSNTLLCLHQMVDDLRNIVLLRDTHKQ